MNSSVDNVTLLYVLLTLWYTPHMTIAEPRLSPRYHLRSTIELLSMENNDTFSIPTFVERINNSPIKGLRKFTERIQTDNSETLPWSCDCNYFWKDLGDGYKPRFIRDGACHSSTCWFGHFECVAQKYEIKVLGRLDVLDEKLEYSTQLSEDYVFTAINVTVNCLCMRAPTDG